MSDDVLVQPGGKILVLPKVPVKNLRVAKNVTQIIFEVALSAAPVFGIMHEYVYQLGGYVKEMSRELLGPKQWNRLDSIRLMGVL